MEQHFHKQFTNISMLSEFLFTNHVVLDNKEQDVKLHYQMLSLLDNLDNENNRINDLQKIFTNEPK